MTVLFAVLAHLVMATCAAMAAASRGFDEPRNVGTVDHRTPIDMRLRHRLKRSRGLVARCVPHTLSSDEGRARGTYGAVQFELFGPGRGQFLDYLRSVSVAWAGGRWTFSANGEPQPFEEIERYDRRKITDRFTPEMLDRYCAAIGVRPWESSFYMGPGTLVTTMDALPSTARVVSLRQAREQLGLAGH